MIILYQFQPIWGLPNLSPFCIKVETYLKMAGLDYKTALYDPRRAPKGKLPFIEDDHKRIADSRFIIRYLKEKYGDVLDDKLTREERAQALLIERLFEEHLYWVGLYIRWLEPGGWEKTKEYFAFLPRSIRLLVPFI